jgi:cytochrome o ubiquinol oxidase operon protein cyoD
VSHADAHLHSAAHEAHGAVHSHGTRRGYLIGFGLSALLTAVPFWLTMTGALGNNQATLVWVVGLAFVQIIVHTVCFLHVNARTEGGWTLLALIFTVVIAAIAVTGSLWIMFHLNSNMMPMTAESLPSTP